MLSKEVNLCESCWNRGEMPKCMPCSPQDIKFGEGIGNDNVYRCSNYVDKGEMI